MLATHYSRLWYGVLIAVTCLAAQKTLADEALQRELKDIELGAQWLYDDWPAAQKAAQRENKPVFAVFR